MSGGRVVGEEGDGPVGDGDEAAGDISGDRGAGGGGARSRVIARMPIDTKIPASGPISLRIDPAKMTLFDPTSGAALR